MTARHIIWTDPDGPGLEHLTLSRESDGWLADGMQIGRTADRPPFRLYYTLHINDDWQMRSAAVRVTAGGPDSPRELSLRVNEDAEWADDAGNPLPELSGCHEICIPVTPFRHTLPIRRLGLAGGEAVDISVARIDISDMSMRAVRQRYTCIRPIGKEGGLFQYNPLSRGGPAELSVDADGLVIDCPGGFQRAWADQGSEQA